MTDVPSLAELYNKYSDKGFHLVALEVQGSTEAAITNFLSARNAKYQATMRGDLKGSNVRGIPHSFLFSPDGKLAAENPRGKQLEEKVKELLPAKKEAPDKKSATDNKSASMAGPGPYKKLAALATQVKAGQELGKALQTLREKKDSQDADEAAEAKMMLEALSSAGKAKLEEALKLKEGKPKEALVKLDRLATQFAGDEIGDHASKALEEVRKALEEAK